MCLFQLLFPQGICPVVGLLSRLVVLFMIFLRILHTILHSGCINLHLHPTLSMCVCVCVIFLKEQPYNIFSLVRHRTCFYLCRRVGHDWATQLDWTDKVFSEGAYSVVSNSTTPGSVALQAPLSMGFSRREYRSGLPFPSLGDLPNPGFEPTSPQSPALASWFFPCWALRISR